MTEGISEKEGLGGVVARAGKAGVFGRAQKLQNAIILDTGEKMNKIFYARIATHLVERMRSVDLMGQGQLNL